MRPLRIAYLCADPKLPVFGRGRESVRIQELIRSLIRLGADVELFVAHQGGSAPDDLYSLITHPLPSLREGVTTDRAHVKLLASQAPFKTLHAAAPFDVVYERHSASSFAGLAWAGINNVPRLLEVNQSVGQESDYGEHQLVRRMGDGASLVIATSEEAASNLRRQGLSPDAIHVVDRDIHPLLISHNSVPTWHWPDGDEAFTIGFVGPLMPRHGVRVVVEAFARIRRQIPGVRLLLVGDGPERCALENRLRALHLEWAAGFAGPVLPKDLPGLLASMDLAIAPYPLLADFYFSQLKAFDYMRPGQSRTAKRICEMGNHLDDENKGVLCDSGDANELADQLTRLRANADLRRRIGEAARKTILTGYAWDHAAAQILCLAESQLSVHLLENLAET